MKRSKANRHRETDLSSSSVKSARDYFASRPPKNRKTAKTSTPKSAPKPSKVSKTQTKSISQKNLEMRNPDEFPDDYYTSDEVAIIRSTISKKLMGIARYVKIKSGTKIAVNDFSDENTTSVPPDEGDYGIVPKKNLFVLDIDSHVGSGVTIESQIDVFSEFLGIDLRNTLAVATPGGGFHAYMLAPVDADNLQSGLQNLNSYSAAISDILGRQVTVDADIRTGKSAGYTVGPTSVSLSVIPSQDEKTPDKRILSYYKIADETHGFSPLSNDADLLTMSIEGFERFARLKNLKQDIADEELRVRREERAAARRAAMSEAALARVSRVSELSKDVHVADEALQLESTPPPDLLRKLEKEMIARNMITFHQKRSFVKAALHCCHSDSAIAQVCMDFDIDRDSGTQDSISYKDLIIDLQRFTPSIRFHGGYCSISQHEAKKAHSTPVDESKVFDLEEFKAKNAAKVASRRVARYEFGYLGAINPKVLDISLISKKLLEGSRRKSPSQQYLDAMKIVDYFLQPLSNVGAKTLLLARTAIETRLEMTASRASQALRILREKEVISVSDKQKTGLAATYFVNEEFTHARLTKTLKMLWGFNGIPLGTGEVDSEGNLKKFHANLYLDRHSGVFREVFTEKIVESNFALVVKWIKNMNEETAAPSISDFGSGAAPSYLKKEAKDRGLSVIGGSETLIVNEETGEIIVNSAEERSQSMTKMFGPSQPTNSTVDKSHHFPIVGKTISLKSSKFLINSSAKSFPGLRTTSAHMRCLIQLETDDPP